MRAMRGIVAATTAAIMLSTTAVVGDDGPMFRKNVSNTPELETEFASIRMLPLYVPVQSSDGVLLGTIEIVNAGGTPVETRDYAQPLIVHYTDGHVEFIDEEGYGGFPGHGQRDAFGAVSLDGGNSWKRTNLSQSGDQSSFSIGTGSEQVDYPGDVGRTFMAADGNKVLVTWVSRYAGGGSPNYAMTDEEREAVALHLGIENSCTDLFGTDGAINELDTPCLYMEDYFGVAGSQRSSDMTDEGYPLVGELPYAAVWAARGVMLPPASEGEPSRFVWFKAERLTSGVRDANRPETVCVKGAGCVVTWQEDPDGIRPGEGEGPGEGWSGAVAHHQTDTWYSYIGWNDFDLVSGDDATYGSFYAETGDLIAWAATYDSGTPKAAIPMAIPVRLTDNAMCVAEGDKPYCYADFDGSDTADFCASTVAVTIDTPEGPTQDVDMCITEDGRLLRGNTASTRARIGLHGYSSLGRFDKTQPDLYPIDSAWFYMAYEENKGLGDICDDGDCEVLTDADKRDMGKNVWYHTFDMFQPELVSQGLMLNQPAVYPGDWTDPSGLLVDAPLSGYNFYAFDEDPIYAWQADLETTTLYQTEISRRPSVMSQDWYDAGPSGLVGFQLWKQGIIRRGGPADIMARRFVIPADGEEQCTEYYSLCTTPYELCTTTYEWCDTEPVCLPNELNLDYDYNRGLCKKDPTQPRCFEFIDGDGNYTNEPETCTEPACYEPESGLCDIAEEECQATTVCDDSLTSCPGLAANQTCTALEQSCTTVGSCPAELAENQTCDWASQTCSGDFDATVDNPYGYDKMVCENPDGSSGWAFTDGSNPRYVKGLCAAPAINLSSNTILTSESCGDAETCLLAFPFNDYFDDLDMTDADPISKIHTWEQTGPGYGEEDLAGNIGNLADTSWANPYDMAKGHRGFLAGDMVMAMYGWTNNWKALTEGKDIVNLYVRRSFDGGLTWSTLPANFLHTDGITYSGTGTTTCEWMGPTGSQTEYPMCVTYAAGDFEQARNVSQLLGNKVTVLDPRYSPTTRSITEAWVSTSSLPEGFVAPLYYDDTRDPSRFFMIYETGYSSAYDAGEAEPLDLFYSRAVEWGDHYLVWQDEADANACLPSAENTELAGFCNEFDALEGSQYAESGEASVTCSPGGMFFHATWNQWDFNRAGVEIGADAWYRGVLFLDDYIPPIDGGTGPGNPSPPKPGK
jgi:hypothetical protein